MEVQRAEPGVAPGGATAGVQLRGRVPQSPVVKGRNRDTAWFAVIDGDWPALREAFRAWLAPSNFDAQGRQANTCRT
jgi:hypothetical protein